jgi:hypothetical protein
MEPSEPHRTEDRHEPTRRYQWGVPSSCFCWEIKSLVVFPTAKDVVWTFAARMCVCVVHPTPKTFRQIANPLRQPLGTLDALTFDLDLIVTPEDARVHEQLRRMHAEIAPADPVLRDGWCALRAYFFEPR